MTEIQPEPQRPERRKVQKRDGWGEAIVDTMKPRKGKRRD